MAHELAEIWCSLAVIALIAVAAVSWLWWPRAAPQVHETPAASLPPSRATHPPAGISDGLAVVLRGNSEPLTKSAYTDGYMIRVLQEVGRRVCRRTSAAELRAAGAGWAGALHGLPVGTYRLQLITPRFLTVASITVLWSERQVRGG